jgi:2'-5' RNA ligase
MIALYPHPDAAERLAMPDGEVPEQLHVTLVYLGKAADFTEEQRQAVHDISSFAADYVPPLSGDWKAASTFGDGSEAAKVLEIDSPELHDLRAAIVSALDEAGVPYDKKWPTYKPHMTLGYGKGLDVSIPSEPFAAHRIGVAWAGKNEQWTLEGESEPVTASGRTTAANAGYPHGKSVKWAKVYEGLIKDGKTKSKAAAISNAQYNRYRRWGRAGAPGQKSMADRKRSLRLRRLQRALTAAGCQDASCAPPPAGTGGSHASSLSRLRASKGTPFEKVNTSVYPVDVLPVNRQGHGKGQAPGAENPAAVRAREGRSVPQAGETVDVYRDLGRGKEHRRGFPDHDAFSVRYASGEPGSKTGLVEASTVSAVLDSPRPAWAQAAKADFEGLRGQKTRRGVHAFIRGEVNSYLTIPEAKAKVKAEGYRKVTYYPGAQDFFHPATRHRFVGGDSAIMVKGEFFVKNPRFEKVPARRGLIEQKEERKRLSRMIDSAGRNPTFSTAQPLEFFNPAQPRDNTGRWTQTSTGRLKTLVSGLTRGGGATVDLKTGESPTSGYCVGHYGEGHPGSTAWNPDGTPSKALRDQAISFAIKHADVLAQPNMTFGVWHDTDRDIVDIDVMEIVSNKRGREEAVRIGHEHGQKSIYHLDGEGEYIQLGGEGNYVQASAGAPAIRLLDAPSGAARAVDGSRPLAVEPERGSSEEGEGDAGEVVLRVLSVAEFRGCQDASCAPPPAGTGGSHIGGRISATVPSSKAESAAFQPGVGQRIEPPLHSDKQRAEILRKIADVPGWEDVAGMSVEQGEKTVLKRMEDNIVATFDQSMAVYGREQTGIHSRWYPVAGAKAREWAKELGFHEDGMIAAMAALSPQADWGDNVAWTLFIAQKVKKNPVVTQEMVNAYEAAQVVSYNKKVKEFKANKRPSGMPAPLKPSGIPVGVPLSDLTPEMAAKAIRGMGNAEGLKQSVFGNPDAKARANRDSALANAVSVLRDPSTANISKRLGNEHKVRSFYNNIREPLDQQFEDVTADTHHFGVAFGHPWPASSPYLSSGKKDEDGNAVANKNIWGAVGTGATGATGAYPLVAEATRRAAKRINAENGMDLRPNQIQSVVWEMHRNAWPSRARTAAVRKQVEEVRSSQARAEALKPIEEIRSKAPGAPALKDLLAITRGKFKKTRTRKVVQ